MNLQGSAPVASNRPAVVWKGKKRVSDLRPDYDPIQTNAQLEISEVSSLIYIFSYLHRVYSCNTHDRMFRSLPSAPLLFFVMFLVTDVPYLQIKFDLFSIKPTKSRQVTVSNHESW